MNDLHEHFVQVPGGMKRRVLRWYDYSWSRGRIQGGGDINTALGLLPDKLKTELALHVNLSVLKKVNNLVVFKQNLRKKVGKPRTERIKFQLIILRVSECRIDYTLC